MKSSELFSKFALRVADAVRLRGPLAADPMARMLHLLLLSVAGWIAVAFFVTVPLTPENLRRIFNTAVLEISLIAALILIRLGYFRSASLTYLVGTWVWATISVAAMGGIRSPLLMLYVALPRHN